MRPQIDPTKIADPFRVWVPLEMPQGLGPLNKAAEIPEFVPVSGLISSELVDLDGELIRQDGIDFSWFLQFGNLIYGHSHWALRGPAIGKPRELRRATLSDGTPATWLDGVLDCRTPHGVRAFLEHRAAVLARAVGMGFSIEGTAEERDPTNQNIVTRAVITAVAIAFNQKNPVATMDCQAVYGLAKAMEIDTSSSDERALRKLLRRRLETIASNEGNGILAVDEIVKAFTGKGPDTVQQPLHQFDPARLSLLKGVADDDLRALRILRRVPDMTFADASLEVACRIKGNAA
jgi:hypothetical protein